MIKRRTYFKLPSKYAMRLTKPKKKSELTIIREIGTMVGANAVRFILSDYDEYDCHVDDCLENKSKIWEDGKPTDIKLTGLCFMLLKNLEKVFCYDKLLFIYSKNFSYGTDVNEIIVSNPKILAILESKRILDKIY